MKRPTLALLLVLGLASIFVMLALALILLLPSTPIPPKADAYTPNSATRQDKLTPSSTPRHINHDSSSTPAPQPDAPPPLVSPTHTAPSQTTSGNRPSDQSTRSLGNRPSDQSTRTPPPVAPLPEPDLDGLAEATVQERLAIVEAHLQGIALDSFDFRDEASFSVYQGRRRELSGLANELEEIAKLELPPALILRAKILRGDVFMCFADQWENAKIEPTDESKIELYQRGFARLALEARRHAMGFYQEALDYAETQQLETGEVQRVRVLLREWTTIVD